MYRAKGTNDALKDVVEDCLLTAQLKLAKLRYPSSLQALDIFPSSFYRSFDEERDSLAYSLCQQKLEMMAVTFSASLL